MIERKQRSLERWFQLMTVLMGGGRYTAAELAKRFGVNVRTIFRDLNSFETMQIPIVRDNGRYWLMETYRLRPVQLNADEVLALAAALDFAKRNRILAGKAAMTAMEKLMAVLPSSQQEIVNDLDETLVVDPVPAHSVECAPGVEKNLTAAIQGSHPVRITYQALAAAEPTDRVVRPYGMAYRGTALYLIGYCELRRQIRTFRANRIFKVAVLPATFERPEDFDLDEYLKSIWGIEDGPLMNVRLRFTKPVARLARETIWHPTQQCADEPDGSVILQMETRGRNELARWLAGFGGTVEVLAPAELRETVLELGRGIVGRYG